MWTPDVYEGAPTPVTAFFAVAAEDRRDVADVCGPDGAVRAGWSRSGSRSSGVASVAVDGLRRLCRDRASSNIKRLMAYSSIGNVGYVLLGLASGSEKGIQSACFYLAIYLVMTMGVFAVILMMERRNASWSRTSPTWQAWARSEPMMALALLVFMFSAGRHPAARGLLGKRYIFIAAVEARLYVPAVLGVLASGRGRPTTTCASSR